MLATDGTTNRVMFGTPSAGGGWRAGVAAESTALGVLAGLLAAAGASAGGWVLATQLFNLGYRFDPMVWLVGITLGAAIVGGAGTFAARSVVNHPPIETLRQ